MTTSFQLGSQRVGLGYPTYFIADIAANHDGDLSRARSLIRLAASAGANAAKFQNFRAETIVSARGFEALGDQFSHQATWSKPVSQVYREASLPIEWTSMLKNECDDAGIDYLTAPYDVDLVDVLDPAVCAWKVGSGDITWTRMIDRLARSGKPVLIATGASEMEDVERAVAVAAESTAHIVVMQCNTNYTGSHDNLRFVALTVLQTYAEAFPSVVLGLSDHTPGHASVLGAVALGARVIEKHFTDDPRRDGPDHSFSMDPPAWLDMVTCTRELESALGPSEKHIMDNELETVVVQRRAIRAADAVPAGTVLSERHLAVLRPCPPDGLPPYRMDELVGRQTRSDLAAGDLVRPEDVR